jgi:hypothetical protein
MGRAVAFAFIWAFCLGTLGALRAFAFTPTVTTSGGLVRWSGPKLNLAGNPINSSGLSESEVFDAVVRSLQRWQAASGGAVGFDYWQGTDPKIYEPNSNYNGLSSFYFSSNANAPTGLTPNILGLTQVWYNTSDGRIVESDTVLNDKNFVFTTNPSDTSGFGSSTASFAARNHVFIENVLTHEFGHAYGLSHSEHLQSTMIFMESPEQAHLSCDEEVAIHAVYPNGDQGSRGSISGSVLTPDGAPILGANVEVISRRRGAVLASAMTDHSGHYSVSGLEPGDYFLMAEPYYAGSGPLPAYYSGMSAAVCPSGDTFGRTILLEGSGFRARTISVRAGQSTGAPAITVGCNNGGAVVSGAESTSEIPVFNGQQDGTGFGVTDRFSGGGAHTYRLSNISGHLEVRVLSYSLYSPVAVSLTLMNANGEPVSDAQSQGPVYTGDSGYQNYDSSLIADRLPPGDYLVEAVPSRLDSVLYPTGPISVDPVPFVLITGTVNEQAPPMAGTIPFNPRCRMPENFASYQSPPGDPPRGVPEDQSSSGGCGMIDVSGGSDSGGGDHSGPTSPGAIGWFLPWLVMAALVAPWRRAR